MASPSAAHSTAISPPSSASSYIETSPLLSQGSRSSKDVRATTTTAHAATDDDDDGSLDLPGGGGGGKHRPSRRPWHLWAALRAALLPLDLENTDSVARDHLANERTFLAWLRTALAFCSVGVALTQISSLSTSLAVPRHDTASAADVALLYALLPRALSTGRTDDGGGGDGRLDGLLEQVFQARVDELTGGRLAAAGVGAGALSVGNVRRPGRKSKLIGGGLIVTGFLILFLGLIRYFAVQRSLVRGAFPASRGPIVSITLLAGALVVAVLGAVVMA